jgi:hypothetical protein
LRRSYAVYHLGGRKEHTYAMTLTVERVISSSPALTELPSLNKIPREDAVRFVLECDCRGTLGLSSFAVAWLIWHDKFECGFCGKGFIIIEMMSEHYSWMEDYSERLEGKEAREKYYSRLEQQAGVLR